MQIILKIVYWTAASGYLLLLLLFASGTRAYTFEDFLKVGLFVGLPLLYLVGSSIFFVRSNSIPRRCAAIALVILAPVAVLAWALFNLPNMGVAR